MSAAKELAVLEAAEREYLIASGWWLRDGLWVHPRDRKHSRIDRVATYKQRQIDAAEENAKAKR